MGGVPVGGSGSHGSVSPSPLFFEFFAVTLFNIIFTLSLQSNSNFYLLITKYQDRKNIWKVIQSSLNQ